MTDNIETYVNWSQSALVRPRLEGVSGDRCTLLALTGPHVLARREWTRAQARGLLESTFFDDPVRIVMMANQGAGRPQGLLHVTVDAAPERMLQQGEAVLLDAILPEGLGLKSLPDHRIRIPLGEHWVPVEPEVLVPIGQGSSSYEDLVTFECRCIEVFDRILRGDLSVDAERLLDQVPGIGMELAAEGGDDS